MTRARVVGAGLSGLAAAWRLAEAGHDVEVVEASPDPGGLIGTVATPYGLVEQAANAFVWDDDIARWFQRLGIPPLFASDSSRRRFLFTDGRPRQWPLGPGASAMLALRLAGASLSGGLRPRGDESVEAWGRRVLGHAATTRLLAPALQGIYAAPAAMLAAGAVFGDRRTSAYRSQRPPLRACSARRSRLAAPHGGMGAIVARLYEKLVARGVTFVFNRRVEALDPAVQTVVCTSAPAAASLLRPHAPALAEALSAIAMTRMVTATAFFEPVDEDLRGFGVLFPRAEGVAALGALFNTEIFARGESYRSETWIYGAVDPAAPLPSSSSIVPAIVGDRAQAHRTDRSSDRGLPDGARGGAAGLRPRGAAGARTPGGSAGLAHARRQRRRQDRCQRADGFVRGACRDLACRRFQELGRHLASREAEATRSETRDDLHRHAFGDVDVEVEPALEERLDEREFLTGELHRRRKLRPLQRPGQAQPVPTRTRAPSPAGRGRRRCRRRSRRGDGSGD